VPRISVVVPIYNVEAYLRECLESLAAQTFRDFEAVMVDDGSTDGSAAIAREFAARDPRFRLLTQSNGGLSRARNTGIADAGGEFLAFLDSDDLLPPKAYERLIGALDETGSDFASGNVHRLTTWGESPTRFLAAAFAETRLHTHVTRFRPLLADRTAWNKLWRRSFWGDRHFPDGVVHEDIPVVIPAHFAARSVDVLADPVYLYRIREGGERSITQRREEPRNFADRFDGVAGVSRFLGERGLDDLQRWYDASAIRSDLALYLRVLPEADEDYLRMFLDRCGGFLSRVPARELDALPAAIRVQWHLVRQRRVPELLAVARAARDGGVPVVRRGLRRYRALPYLDDGLPYLPRRLYRAGPSRPRRLWRRLTAPRPRPDRATAELFAEIVAAADDSSR
jgi:glycosyltransferase involved in cell wall biosynthesis